MVLLVAAFAVLSRHSTVRLASVIVPGLLALAVCMFARRTGAGFNPARVLGPDVAAGQYPAVGVYVVASLLGPARRRPCGRASQAERSSRRSWTTIPGTRASSGGAGCTLTPRSVPAADTPRPTSGP